MRKFIFMLAFMLVPFFTFAAFPVDYNANYDITEKDITLKQKKYSVNISATRPMKPMEEFTLTYKFDKAVASVNFTSNMEMNMGKFEYAGKKVSDNVFTVNQTLVKCHSGRTKWYTKADVTFADGSKDTFYIFYDVK